MQIGHITHSYYPNVGGIENYIRRIKFSLEGRGHKVNVYTTDWRVKEKTREKNVKYFKTDLEIFRNPISFEISKYLIKTNDDVYHFHAPWFLISLLAEKAIKNKPKVMTLHGIQLHGNEQIFILNTLYYPLAKHLFDKMNVIIAQAENEYQILIQRFHIDKNKLRIIPNGIEVDKFKYNKTEYKKFIEKYGLKKDNIKILFVSRLVPHKHPDQLIKAVRNYLQKEELEVIIIGDGKKNYFNYLKNLASNDNRIHFLGQVSFNELVAAYYSSDVLVFLSTWDAMSAVVLEAMVCGLPIITTTTGCIPFVVKECENGFYVEPKSRDIATKIKNFIELDKEELNKIKKSNRKKILKNYNWEDKVEDIIKTYQEVVKK